MKQNEYQIKKLSDFLAVPKQKQAECLRDFSYWLDMCRQKDRVQEDLDNEFPGLKASLSIDSFVWIDDNIEGISDVSFTVDGREIGRAVGGRDD